MVRFHAVVGGGGRDGGGVGGGRGIGDSGSGADDGGDDSGVCVAGIGVLSFIGFWYLVCVHH